MTPPTLIRWRNYMRECASPSSWIDLGWYFAVSAALQRRVWFYDQDRNPLYLNLFGVMIGPAGCGKGGVLRPVDQFFRHPSMRKNHADRTRDLAAGEEVRMKIPLGPTDASYQAILDELVAQTGVHRYEKDGATKNYIHASMFILLDELNSLFKRHSNETPNFLLNAYDCRDHDYKTRTKGKNIISKMCVTLLAGCTDTMIKDAARYGIFEDGFVSRCIFAFEFEPRFYTFDNANHFDDEQVKDWEYLLAHLQKLTGLFGAVDFTPEAHAWLVEQFNDIDVPLIKSAYGRIKTYYARKTAHVKKLAAIVHFARDFSMQIGIEDAKEARRILDELEPKMKIGFSSVGRNEMGPFAREVVKAIRSYPMGMSLAELLVRFGTDLTKVELDEIIMTLVLTCQIRPNGDRYYA